MKILTLLALSFALTGCYGNQIAALRDQMSYMETRESILNANVRQLERDAEDNDNANYRISKMVSDMNEYNVCPRQLDRRLQAIEKALKMKKISFTPDWIYRVRADGGGIGDSGPMIIVTSTGAFATYHINNSSIAWRGYLSTDTLSSAEDADSRQRRSNPYSN